ncbi:MAG TPA: ATP-binding cassette domain-containing protein [Candidatus Dormibacteraeota bacterium]|nr:ATP-binding cassette domain-containing protein [Candidatus Dormibacteraeota bacterium]
MATAVDDRGGRRSGGKRRQRKRASAEAKPQVQPVDKPQPDRPDDLEALAKAVAVMASPEPVAVPANDGNGHDPAVAPAVLLPTTEASPPEEFTDLLGQAVGLRIDAVSREFGRGDEMHVTALKDISLQIGPGEFVSIVGPSGCGKTTLLSLMGGLDKPSAGHVYAAGLPVDQLSDGDLANYRLQRVSTIFQTFNLVPSMTAQDNVALPLTLAGVELEERRKRARHLLALVGLEKRARTRANRLSGGEQQKVAVARALANRPGLILADEPTGSLDSAAGEVILSLLEDLNRRGATVVLVTHDPQVARRARRVVRMIDGRAIELDQGNETVRNQDPVTPPTRLNWRDTLKVGLRGTGRRPLRTSLTTIGVAIGIAAMTLIVALAGGLQGALSSPTLARSQLHQVVVYPSGDVNPAGFSSATLSTLSALQHVRASWGEVAMSGTFAVDGASAAPVVVPTGALVSLPPRSYSPGFTVIAGRMPRSDSAPEVLLTDRTALALGYRTPEAALGTTVNFDATSGNFAVSGPSSNAAKSHFILPLAVVGIISSQYMPAGAPGGLAPYSLAKDHWARLAQINGWRAGEFANITLLADSSNAVDGLRQRVETLGFQAQTFGDLFRGFEDLLTRLRIALLALAVVALLLACLGIANTMYSAVLERTKEIGVLKALGARSHDVLLLFVAEAALIGVAGGLIGTFAAVGLAQLGNAAVDRLAQSVASAGIDVFRPDIGIAIGALALALLLSTVSGLLPAVRAARQDPSRALRYE